MLNKYTSITYFFIKWKSHPIYVEVNIVQFWHPSLCYLLRNAGRGRCMTERVGAELDLRKKTTFTWKNSQELFWR